MRRHWGHASVVWLSGLVADLVLAAVWLSVDPGDLGDVGAGGHDRTVVAVVWVVGFLLADVTSTNVLGLDAQRVAAALERGVSLRRLLVRKNLVLLLCVGVPALAVTALVTLGHEPVRALALTLPPVAFPLLAWLGLGNLVSVVLPEPVVPLRERWARRGERGRTLRWLGCLALPWALSLGVDPLADLLVQGLARWHRRLPAGVFGAGGLALLAGLALYAAGTLAALSWARRRGLRLPVVPIPVAPVPRASGQGATRSA